jgi:YD repeat-containing protein
MVFVPRGHSIIAHRFIGGTPSATTQQIPEGRKRFQRDRATRCDTHLRAAGPAIHAARALRPWTTFQAQPCHAVFHPTRLALRLAPPDAGETNSLGDTRQFTYDSSGNVVKKVGRNNRETDYTYDSAGDRSTLSAIIYPASAYAVTTRHVSLSFTHIFLRLIRRLG